MPEIRWSNPKRRPLLLLSITCALLLSSAPPVPADILDSDWAREESPHFDVLGALSQRQARALASDLELFRRVVLVLTGVKNDASAVPTEVLAVEGARQWSELGLPGDSGGVFIPSWRENQLALEDHRDPLHRAAAQHGYVHYLISKPDDRDVPLWYSEGFAELLSTVQKKRDRIAVGLVPDWVEKPLALGSWIPLRTLVDPGDLADASIDQQSMFRAESWALVHYLMVGGSYKDTFTARLDAYMKGVAEGKDSGEAFESAFEIDLASLDVKLHRYVERKRFPALALPPERFGQAVEIRASRPTKSQVAVAIGRLRAAMHERAGARQMFDRAIALDPKNADAQAALGEWLMDDGQLDLAETQLERAARSAPDDPTIQLDLGAVWLERASSRTDAAGRQADIERARQHIEAAWQLDQSAPEAYARLGRSYLILGDDPARAVELLEGAERILPSDPAIQILLAEAWLAVGRDADAEAKLRAVVANPHVGEKEKLRATEELARVAARPADASAPKAPAPAAQGR